MTETGIVRQERAGQERAGQERAGGWDIYG